MHRITTGRASEHCSNSVVNFQKGIYRGVIHTVTCGLYPCVSFSPFCKCASVLVLSEGGGYSSLIQSQWSRKPLHLRSPKRIKAWMWSCMTDYTNTASERGEGRLSAPGLLVVQRSERGLFFLLCSMLPSSGLCCEWFVRVFCCFVFLYTVGGDSLALCTEAHWRSLCNADMLPI